MIRTWLRKLFPGVSRPVARPGAKPNLVNLEDRVVPALLDLTGTVLTYTGTNGVDAPLTVGFSAGKLNFTTTTADALDLKGSIGPGLVTNFSLSVAQTSSLTSVIINLGSGDRTLTATGFATPIAAPFAINGGGSAATTFDLTAANAWQTAGAFSATNFGAITLAGTGGISGAGVTLAAGTVTVGAPVDAGTGALALTATAGAVAINATAKANTAVTVTATGNITIASGKTVESVASTVGLTADGDVLAAGAALISSTGTNIAVDADNAGGGAVNLLGSTVTGGGATLTGNGKADTFTLSSLAASVTVNAGGGTDKLVLDGGAANALTATADGKFKLGGGGTIDPTGSVETYTAQNITSVTANGDAAANAFVLTLGTNPTLAVGAFPAITLPASGLTGISVNGNAGADLLTVNAPAATNFGVPVTFNGTDRDAADNLVLNVVGQATAVTASGTTAGSGTANIGGSNDLSFLNLTNVDVLGDGTTKSTVGVTTTGGVTATLAGGNDFATGTVKAVTLVPGGASDFANVAVRNATTATFATNGSAGTDALTVNATDTTANTGVTGLTVTTGTDAGDSLTVAGAVQVSGNVSLTSQNVNLNAGVGGANISVTATGGAVSIAAAQAPTGSFTATAGTTLSNTAGATIAATAVSLTAGTTLTVGDTVTASTGNATLQGGGLVTLNAGVATTVATKTVSVTSTGGAVSIAVDQTPGGSFAASAGTDLTVTSGKAITVAGTNTLGLKVGQSAAGVANLVGASFVTGGVAVTLAGGAKDDIFNVGKYTADIAVDGLGNTTADPGDTLVIDGQSVNILTDTAGTYSLGGGLITPTNVETVNTQNTLPAGVQTISGNNSANTITLFTNSSGNPRYRFGGSGNGTAINSAKQLVINGNGGDDTVLVILKAGESLATFSTVGIVFDGGSGNDGLILRGAGQTTRLTLDSTNAGDGFAKIGATTLTFTNLDPVDVSGMALATVNFTTGGIQANVDAGVDFLSGGGNKAIRVTPTGGTVFESVALWNNTTVVIDTTVNAGNDVITVNSTGAAADHKNTNLTITAETAAGENDQVTFAGSNTTALTGDLTVTAKNIATTAGKTITAANVSFTAAGGTITHPGTVTAATNATFSAAAGTINAAGGNTTGTAGAVNFTADAVTGGTTSGKTGVTLAAASGDAASTSATSSNGPVSITASNSVTSGTVSANGAVTLTGTNGGVTATGTTTSTGGTATVGGKTDVSLAGLSAAAAVNVTSSTGAVGNTGATTSTGSTVTVTADTNVNLAGTSGSGLVQITATNGTLTATGSTTSTAGAVVLGGKTGVSTAAVSAFTDVTGTSTAGGFTATGLVQGIGGKVTVTPNGAVGLAGVSANGDVTLTSATLGVTNSAGTTSSNGLVSVSAPGNVGLGDVAAKNSATVTSTGGTVGAATTSVSAGPVNYSGDQGITLTGNTTGNTSVTLTAANGGVAAKDISGTTDFVTVTAKNAIAAQAVLGKNAVLVDSATQSVTLTSATSTATTVTLDAGDDLSVGTVSAAGAALLTAVDKVTVTTKAESTGSTATASGAGTVTVAAIQAAGLAKVESTGADASVTAATSTAGAVDLKASTTLTSGTVSAATTAALQAATVNAGATSGPNGVTITGTTAATTTGATTSTAAGVSISAPTTTVNGNVAGQTGVALTATTGVLTVGGGAQVVSAAGDVTGSAGTNLDGSAASLFQSTTGVVNLTINTGANPSATLNLVGAVTAPDVRVGPGKTATFSGNDAGNETFRVTWFTDKLTIDGKNPVLPTLPGDTVILDGGAVTKHELASFTASGAKFKTNAAPPAPFVANTLGGAITFVSIETTQVANVPDVVVNGTNAADVLYLVQNAGAPFFKLNGVVTPLPASLNSFTFNGFDGNDTMIVVLATGELVPAATVKYDGGNDVDGLRFEVAGQDAKYVPDAATAGTGVVTVGTIPLTFTTAEALDFTGFNTLTYGVAGAANALTVAEGFDFTNTLATPALNVSGTTSGGVPAITKFAVWNTATLVLDTSAVAGNDTITVAGANNAHGVTNFTASTGTGADAVTFTGDAKFGGAIALTTKDVSATAGKAVTAGTSLTATLGGALSNNGTLAATAGSVNVTADTVAANFATTAGGSVSLFGTNGVTSTTATGATGVTLNSTAGAVASTTASSSGGPVNLVAGTTVTSTTVTAGTTATLNGKNGVASKDVTAAGAVAFTSTAGAVNSTGTATSTGSTVTMTGQTGVTNATAAGQTGVTLTSAGGPVVSAAATSAAGPVAMTAGTTVTSTTVNAGTTASLTGTNLVTSNNVTAAGAVTLTSPSGAVISSGTATSTGSSVAYSGQTGVTANVTAAQTNVTATSAAASVALNGATTTTTGTVTATAGTTVAVAAPINAQGNVTLTAGSQLTLTPAGTVNSKAGSVGGSAGTSLQLNGATATAAAGAVGFTFGGNGAGATADLLGANLAAKAGTFATVTGGTGGDTVLANAGYAAAAKVDGAGGTDTLRVSGTTVSVSGSSVGTGANQYLGYANFETVALDGAGVAANQATTVTAVGDDPFLGTTTPRADAAVVDKAGVGFTLTLNGQKVSAPGLNKLNVSPGALNDTLRLNYAAGTPIPPAGIAFDGGTGTDAVVTVGTTGQNAVFTASGTAAGSATLAIDADPPVTLTAVEGADFTKFNKVTLNYGGANEALTLGDGTGFVIPAAAIRVGGTTAGNTVTTAAVWSTNQLVVDTQSVSDGADTVAVNGFSGTHKVLNLAVRTGVGGDAVTVAGAGAVPGDIEITTGGSLAVNANLTAGFSVLLTTTDLAAAGQNISVASGVAVTGTAGVLTVTAGDNLTAPGAVFTAKNAITFAVDPGAADPAVGATVNLLNATISLTDVSKTATITGGTDSDSFQLTSTVSPIALDGNSPVAPTFPGDSLTFDAKGLDITATADTLAAGGKPVQYKSIESLSVTNAKNVSIDGTNGDDTLIVSLTGLGQFQYQLNANPVVILPGIPLFNFNGLAGKDLVVVDFVNGDPIPVGGLSFDGGADADAGLCFLGNNTSAVAYDAAGKVSVSDGKFVTFTNLEPTSRVDLTKFSAATLTVPAGGSLVTGKDATAGGTNAALVLTAGAGPAVGVWTVPGLTVNAGVTVNAANGPGTGVSALTVNGGTATFAGTSTFAGDVTANAGAAMNAATLSAGSLTVTGATTVPATSTVNAGAGGAAFNGPVDGPGGLTVNTPGATKFAAAVGGTTPLASLTTDAGGTTSLATGSVTTAGILSFGDAVSFVGDGAFTSTGDSVLFSGGVTADAPTRTLTISAAKNVTVAGDVGPLASVGVPTATDVTFGGKVTAGAVAVGTVNDLKFTGAVEAPGGAVTVTKANNVTFGGTVNAGTVTVTQANDVTTGGSVTTTGAFAITTAAIVTVGGTTSAGSVEVGTATNVTFNGTIATAGAVTITSAKIVTFSGEVGSQETPVFAVSIASAQDVTFGGTVNAKSVTQTAGTGKTTFSKQLTASGTGKSVSVNTKNISFNGSVAAETGEVYLKSNGGEVTQDSSSGAIATRTLRLDGSGNFNLATIANRITGGSATQGDLFVTVSGGSVAVWDSTDLFLRFEDANSPETALRVTNGSLSLSTSGSFDATDTATDTNAKYTTALIDVGKGTVRINPGVGKDAVPSDSASSSKASATNVRFVAEVTAEGKVFVGNSLAKGDGGNVNLDRFTIRPSKGAILIVDGNNPTLSSGSGFSPWDTLNPILAGLPTPKLTPDGTNAGTYTFGDGSLFKALQYLNIETLGGIALQAFAVQTGPVTGDAFGDQLANKYAIRLLASQTSGEDAKSATTTNFNTPLGGNGSVSNPFVVSPVRANPDQPFGPPSVAVADVNADGTPDLIIANGPAEGPLVTIIDGIRFRSDVPLDIANLAKSEIIAQFYAYEPTFVGGVTVKAADLNGDGRAEIVVGARQGGGQRVQVFEIPGPGGPAAAPGKDTTPESKNNVDPYSNFKIYGFRAIPGTTQKTGSFFAFDENPDFRGGVNVALGDVDGDGFTDVICGAGVGGGPRVIVYSGKTGEQINSFFAYEADFRGGVYVDAGRYDGDLIDDVVTAPGSNGGPRVRVFAGQAGIGIAPFGSPSSVLDFFAVSPPGSLVSNDRVVQNGLSGIAFGGSFDGSGGNRSILVSTPRGQQTRVLQFDPDDFDPATKALKGKPEDLAKDILALIVVTNPIAGTDITKLQDGGSVGGYAAASGFE